MKRWLPRIGIGLAALLIVLTLLLVDFIASFQRSLPTYNGSVSVAGPTQPVQILRDRYAIPHILAVDFPDAAFGLGYAHAQDRLWQMEMARRFVQGRLAELFGASAVPTDTMMRVPRIHALPWQMAASIWIRSKSTLRPFSVMASS